MVSGPLREAGSPPAVEEPGQTAYVEAAFVQPAARWPFAHNSSHSAGASEAHCLTSALQ